MEETIYHVSFPGLGDWANFTLDPVAFRIGTFEVRWYGVIIALGVLLGFLYAMANAKRFGINSDKLVDAVIVGLITGIVGARLYYVIFYPGDQYWKDPISIFYVHEGGLAIYGGIIGGLLGGGLMAKHHKLCLPAVLDIAMIGFLIGQGIGRWGNFINQEAFGVATNLPWAMVSENTGGVGVHPCFLYESIWCLLGVLLLHLFSKRRQYDGQLFLLYLVWYGIERFVVEGLRTDSLFVPNLPIRVSQLLAICTALVGIVLLIVFRNRRSLCVNRQALAAEGPAPAAEEEPSEGCDCAHCPGCSAQDDGEQEDSMEPKKNSPAAAEEPEHHTEEEG